VAMDWGYLDSTMGALLEQRLDTVCAITWSLAHRR